MNSDATLALAPALVAAFYGHRYLVRRWEATAEKRAACKHVNRRREGGPYNRTEWCDDCGSQWPITMTRCPKCREWSDAE